MSSKYIVKKKTKKYLPKLPSNYPTTENRKLCQSFVKFFLHSNNKKKDFFLHAKNLPNPEQNVSDVQILAPLKNAFKQQKSLTVNKKPYTFLVKNFKIFSSIYRAEKPFSPLFEKNFSKSTKQKWPRKISKKKGRRIFFNREFFKRLKTIYPVIIRSKRSCKTHFISEIHRTRHFALGSNIYHQIFPKNYKKQGM